jgi:hypothetical protein
MATNPLPPGDIQFFDNCIPQLHDGNYTITATQTLGGVPGAPASPSTSRAFTVSGPRFQIDPTEVHSQFPPSNHSGQFEEHLPNIVLKKRTLPWERYLDPANENVPWIALLLFDAGGGAAAGAQVSADGKVTLTVTNGGAGYEIAPIVTIMGGDGTGASALATINGDGQVTGFVMTNPGSGYTTANAPKVTIGTPTNGLTTTVQQVLTPGNDASGNPIFHPNLTLAKHESASSPCRVIDVSATAFAAYTPRYVSGGADELTYLAHARQVNTSSKEPLGLVDADGWFSVLVAKRFPRPAGTAPNQTANPQIAHLVSLEGYAGYLSGSPNFGASQMVRLVSLSSWAFTCQPTSGESFSDLMNDLEETENGTSYLLKLPYHAPATPAPDPAALAQATGTLDLGYLPMSYQTRQGEFTFAWYRGPLAPVLPKPFADNPHLATAAQATIYDPQWGVFDQSLAAAWQTGRLLALSDKTFATTLLAWRREGHQMVNLLAERLPAAKLAALQSSNESASMEVLEQNYASQQFMDRLVSVFGRRIAPKMTEPGNAVSPLQKGGVRLASPTLEAAPKKKKTVAELRQLMANPGVRSLLQNAGAGLRKAGKSSGPNRQKAVAEWLAALGLLYGVPFKNLVPSPDMLPMGSIRFFYLDQNIVHAMIDGAMSVGGQTERDTLYYEVMRNVLLRSANRFTHEVRPELLGQPTSNAPVSGGPIAGFLLRSAVVSGWPGLEIKGFADAATASVQISSNGQISLAVANAGSGYDPAHPPEVTIDGGDPGRDAAANALVNAQGQVTGFTMTNPGSGYVASNPPRILVEPTGPITLLRMDRLSADVLICLFPEVPRWIEIAEPREGLAFGVEDPPRGAPTVSPIYLRHVLGENVGEQFGLGSDNYVDATPFTADDGILDVLGLKAAMEANALLKTELAQKGYQPGELSPGDLALQMVKLPERMIFSF